MKLIDLADPIWEKIDYGYDEYNSKLVEWLNTIQSEPVEASHWDFLWEELHHQNDVWEASYAVIPYLLEYSKKFNDFTWHIFGFASVVELARLDIENPAIPSAFKELYFNALQELATLALTLPKWNEEQTPVMSSIIALSKGQRVFARAYLELSSRKTALRYLDEETGWEPTIHDI